jgi:hypothetical protein
MRKLWITLPAAIQATGRKFDDLGREWSERTDRRVSPSYATTEISRLNTGKDASIRKWVLNSEKQGEFRALLYVLGIREKEQTVIEEGQRATGQAEIWIKLPGVDKDTVRQALLLLKELANHIEGTDREGEGFGFLLPAPEGEIAPNAISALKAENIPLCHELAPNDDAVIVSLSHGQRDSDHTVSACLGADGWRYSPMHRFMELLPPRPQNWESAKQELEAAFPGELMVKIPPLPSPYREFSDVGLGGVLKRFELMLEHRDAVSLRAAYEDELEVLRREGSRDRTALTGKEKQERRQHYDSWSDDNVLDVPGFEGVDRISALLYLIITGRIDGRIPWRIAAEIVVKGFSASPTLGDLPHLGQSVRLAPQLPESGAELRRPHDRYGSKSPLASAINGKLQLDVGSGPTVIAKHWLAGPGEKDEGAVEPVTDGDRFAIPGRTMFNWEPPQLDMGGGDFLARVDETTLIFSGPIPPQLLELDRLSGTTTLGVSEVYTHAAMNVHRWSNKVWRGHEEWRQRKQLWDNQRPEGLDARALALDEAARRVAEGLFAKLRPVCSPLQSLQCRRQDHGAEAAAQAKNLLDQLRGVATACDVPATVAVLLDAIRSGAPTFARPNSHAGAWDVDIHTFGGEIIRLTTWARVSGAERLTYCGFYVAEKKDYQGRIQTKAAVALSAEHIPEEALAWYLKVSDAGFRKVAGYTMATHDRHLGELEAGKVCVRIRAIESCPQATGGQALIASGIAVAVATEAEERARARQMEADDDD